MQDLNGIGALLIFAGIGWLFLSYNKASLEVRRTVQDRPLTWWRAEVVGGVAVLSISTNFIADANSGLFPQAGDYQNSEAWILFNVALDGVGVFILLSGLGRGWRTKWP